MRATRWVAGVVALGGVLLATSARTEEGGGQPTVLPARITSSLDVSGACRIDRDVTIEAGATLRFLAGTRVEIAPKDADASGYFPATCEIHVLGRIMVDGTADRPVIFDGGAVAELDRPNWSGIFLHAERSRAPDSVLVHARFRGASEAVRLTDGTPRIERCAFDSCRVGVASGRFWSAELRLVEECRRPAAHVEECLFVRCKTGVYAELWATPFVSRSSFVGNECALGNVRHAYYWFSLRGLGPRVDRCYFAGNQEAVTGASVVENSVFVLNAAVFRTTLFHMEFSQSTDWIAWRRNVFFGNVRVTDGESDVGSDNVEADPRFGSPPPEEAPAFESLVVPLPGLDLAAASPVRGTSTDGGDPGPAGRAPRGRRRRPWASADAALRMVLVLGPPEKTDPAVLPKAAPPSVGARVGEAWWAAFAADETGGLDRSTLRWPEAVETIAVAALWRADADHEPQSLELNVDGTVAVWSGGSALPIAATPLRFGTRRARPPRRGGDAGGVVVWWKSADFDPRIGIAVHAADAHRVPGLVPPPGVAALDAEPIGFGPRQIGLRPGTPYHWADVSRPGVFRLRAANGSTTDLAEHGITVYDAKGTLRADLPPGVAKKGARFVVDGLRDPWGRTLAGQPFELDAEARR